MNANKFLVDTRENGDFNQYWYSPSTIDAMVQCIESAGPQRVAFLSTPSLYFSLTDHNLRTRSNVFDLDEQWRSDRGYVRYDFRHPELLPSDLHHQFDYFVIDPPFITEEVWQLYTEAVRLLGTPDCKILCSTIQENKDMMWRLLQVEPRRFLPSIPHLVYQYCLYSNHSSDVLDQPNPEIPDY